MAIVKPLVFYDDTKRVEYMRNTDTAPGGIIRSILPIATATTGAAVVSTDYVYLTTGTFTFTLPTAVGNTNRYSLKVTDGGTITLATTSGQLVDNVAPGLITFPTSLDFVSNGTNWFII